MAVLDAGWLTAWARRGVDGPMATRERDTNQG
jgi:hypothetical protein